MFKDDEKLEQKEAVNLKEDSKVENQARKMEVVEQLEEQVEEKVEVEVKEEKNQKQQGKEVKLQEGNKTEEEEGKPMETKKQQKQVEKNHDQISQGEEKNEQTEMRNRNVTTIVMVSILAAVIGIGIGLSLSGYVFEPYIPAGTLGRSALEVLCKRSTELGGRGKLSSHLYDGDEIQLRAEQQIMKEKITVANNMMEEAIQEANKLRHLLKEEQHKCQSSILAFKVIIVVLTVGVMMLIWLAFYLHKGREEERTRMNIISRINQSAF